MAFESENPRSSSLIRDYGATIFVAIVIALGIRFFVIEAYRIPTPNMRPTLEPGDTVFVAKWPFGLRLPGQQKPFTQPRAPERGEVVVYAVPEEPTRDSIRRVVALAGDRFEIRKGLLIVNGRELRVKNSKPPAQSCTYEEISDTRYEVCTEPPPIEDVPLQVVPAGSLLLMGDYRVQWTDPARKLKNWSVVPVSALKARARWVWLSIEPSGAGARASWFSRIRFERMFREIR